MRKKCCPGCCNKGANAVDAANALVLENANPMGAAVGSHIGSTLGEQLGGSLGSSIGSAVGDKLGDRYDPVQESTPQPSPEQPMLGSTLEIVATAIVRNGILFFIRLRTEPCILTRSFTNVHMLCRAGHRLGHTQ